MSLPGHDQAGPEAPVRPAAAAEREASSLGGELLPTGTVLAGRADRLYFPLKRLMDLAIALTVLVVLAPVLLAIALVIRLDSPGPALFVQPRVGSRRRVVKGRTEWEIRRFPIYKFRTMTRLADEAVHRAYIAAFVRGRAAAGESASPYKLAHDARITRVGRWLRRTSLDELPQLINVLRGEMSVVGPRPVPDYEVAEYPDADCLRRLATLPGITGLWQVTARSQVGFAEMIRLDCDYVRRQSVRLDLKIMLLTPRAVLSGKGAG